VSSPGRIRALALAALGVAVGAGLSASARAGELRDEQNHFRLTLDEGWTRVELAAVPDGPIAGYRHDGHEATLAVSRVDVPNPAAWKGDKAFFREVEDGVAATTPGYKRVRSKQRSVDGVPVLDLVFTRDGADGTARETTGLRLVFFRTFSLSAAVSAPTSAWKQHDKALTAAYTGLIPVR
jgi:hypothetical protein